MKILIKICYQKRKKKDKKSKINDEILKDKKLVFKAILKETDKLNKYMKY